MSKLTKGTEVYFLDDTGTAEIVKVECATSFNPGSEPAGEIDDTCLDSETMKFIAGMRNPGSATLGIRPDPESESHVKMFGLSQMNPSKDVTWLVGWSDGTEPPTVDVGGELTLPNTRTWLKLNGYISEYPFDFQLNATVTGDLSIKRTGGLEWIKKGVTP